MCGRLACTLNRKELQKSCCQVRRRYRKKDAQDDQAKEPHKYDKDSAAEKLKLEPADAECQKYFKPIVGDLKSMVKNEQLPAEEELLLEPQWLEVENLEYKVNHNLSPTQVVPCLIKQDGLTALMPMIWGFIPLNHKGTPANHGLSTFNARAEGLQTSPLYKNAFKTGKRCAVICTGFYEWKTINGKKQPFFFHLPQESGIFVDDQSCKDEEEGPNFRGPRITPLAGVFHYWMNPRGEKVPNVTIVTMATGKWVSWCHHRMPVVLDSPDKIEKWLDDKVGPEEAVKMFVEPNVINWYPVKKDFYLEKSIHPLRPIRVNTTELVPEFVTEWDPEIKVCPPELGKHKSTVKRSYSPEADSDIPKKQRSLMSWLLKKEKTE